jgi:tellurite resistance protein TehA-like permease
MGAPISRIMWSAQTGIVVALAGLGLAGSRSFVMEELSQPLMVIALFAMSIGVGFIISAMVSYLLSRHLGLLTPRAEHA